MLADRAILRLSGDGVRDFIQSLVTQDVTGDLPVWAGLLTPQGKCLFDFIVWPDGEDLLIDCEAAAADDLARRLSIYRLRRPISIERDAGLFVHWQADGQIGAPDPRLEQLGRRWLGPADEPAKGWLEHRLRLGVCEGRIELGDLLWLECNAAELNGVSFTKGCFVGQENTARMNWRHKVNRQLLVVEDCDAGQARALYPELSLAIVHARVDDVPEHAVLPKWLRAALA
jgi:folate-binding protein YgfZ